MGTPPRVFHAPKLGKIRRPNTSGGLLKSGRDLAQMHFYITVDLLKPLVRPLSDLFPSRRSLLSV